LKGYRAQTLGVAAGAGGLVNALAQWAIGDLTLFSLIRALGDNWALIAGGLGLATLGAKLERQSAPAPELGETVSDIADRALRR
jgi:hypothetical protein